MAARQESASFWAVIPTALLESIIIYAERRRNYFPPPSGRRWNAYKLSFSSEKLLVLVIIG